MYLHWISNIWTLDLSACTTLKLLCVVKYKIFVITICYDILCAPKYWNIKSGRFRKFLIMTNEFLFYYTQNFGVKYKLTSLVVKHQKFSIDYTVYYFSCGTFRVILEFETGLVKSLVHQNVLHPFPWECSSIWSIYGIWIWVIPFD